MDCVWSVQSLSSEIKKSLAGVSCKRVRGIVGRVTRSQSGHAYFEVIDECGDARIGCAVWASKASTTVPEPGLCELGISRIDFYAPQGRCQLIVSDTTPIGGATTQKALLLAKLHQEGLLDRCRLALPYPVQHLCIVTSSGSAAAHDMLKSVEERWSGLRTTLIHSAVQGVDAPKQLVDALDAARKLNPPADVIVCGRGGGSEADLCAFDDETVARAFARGPVPVVSAVGHESDHSISDAVADLRAKTPTGAIELVLPVSRDAMQSQLLSLRRALLGAADNTLRGALAHLRALRDKIRTRVAQLVSSETKTLSFHRHVLRNSVRHSLERQVQRLQKHRASIQAASKQSCAKQGSLHQVKKRELQRQTLAAIERQKRMLANLKTALEAHALPTAWSRGFFTLCDASNRRVRKLEDLQEGTELCVRDGNQIVFVTVRKCQRIH